MRGLLQAPKKLPKPRQAIEPIIGYTETDVPLALNSLKDSKGVAIDSELCGAEQNTR